MYNSKINLTFYFVRHGETQFNKKQVRINGRTNYAPLTVHGSKQAKSCGEWLQKTGAPIHFVFSSPAKRTSQTAKIVAEIINFPKKEIRYFDALLELDQGFWEGLNRNKVYTPAVIHHINQKSPDFSPPNGESMREVQQRMLTWIYDTIINNKAFTSIHPQATILIVGHGIAFKCLFQALLGFDSKMIYRLQLDNCSISEFTYTQEGWFPIRINDRNQLCKQCEAQLESA